MQLLRMLVELLLHGALVVACGIGGGTEVAVECRHLFCTSKVHTSAWQMPLFFAIHDPLRSCRFPSMYFI